jgi:HEPN domain-containing protein
MPRPKPREEARVWLQFAADDFRAACGLMAMSPPAIRQALVQGQQAAEKALKAFLIGNGQLYPLTHDLERLRELCVVIDATLDAVARPCLDLTQFASLMRYPGCPDLPELELAWPWLHSAEALVAAVAERLGGASQEPAAGMR